MLTHLLAVTVALAMSAAGASDPIRYAMEPIWAIEAERGDDVVFGQIEDVVVGADNTAYVLDSQLDQVKVIDEGGNPLRNLGRAGDGPGEFRAPGSLVLMPDGTLGVVSRQFSRITMLDPVSGDPRGALVLEGAQSSLIQLGRVRAMGGVGQQSGVVAVVGEPQVKTRGKLEYRMRMYLAAFPFPAGAESMPPRREILAVGLATGQDVEEEDYYRLWDPWTVLDSGLIVAAPYWSEYLVRWLDRAGEVRGEVRRPFDHLPRSALEKQRLLNFLWGGVSPAEFGIELVPSEYEAVVRSLYARPKGEVWVRTNRAGARREQGVFMVLDRFGPDGDYRGVVELVGPGDEGLDRAYFGAGNYLVVVHGAERFIRSARGKSENSESHALGLAGYRLVVRGAGAGGRPDDR